MNEAIDYYNPQGGLADLTDGEQLSQEYLYYPGRPVLLDAEEVFETGVLKIEDPNIIFTPSSEVVDLVGDEKVIIPGWQQYDLLPATFFGLNNALVQAELGGELRDKFDAEWDLYTRLTNEGNIHKYGAYLLIPASRELHHFPPSWLHRLSLEASTSGLWGDRDGDMDREEIRSIHDTQVIAVAGASVGGETFDVLQMDLLCKRSKIADPNLFKLDNRNRRRLPLRYFIYPQNVAIGIGAVGGLRNKAIATADMMYETDPYRHIIAYFDGVTDENREGFLAGNRIEPRTTVVVEAVDNLKAKISLARDARQQSIDVYRPTDAGSIAQVDTRRFSVDSQAPLAYGIVDADLDALLADFDSHPSKKTFFATADGLLGKGYREGEFGKILSGERQRHFKSIAQKGSTATAASAMVTEMIARRALGWKYPERVLFDMSTMELTWFGEWV